MKAIHNYILSFLFTILRKKGQKKQDYKGFKIANVLLSLHSKNSITMKDNFLIEAIKVILSMFSGCLPWLLLLAFFWGLAMILFN